jgi:predicted regulator of Ras-like GTPase activity (Roadblock/LC7/MglB family)
MVKPEIERSASHINKLAESQDLDDLLSYLSLVNGIDGAILYNAEGWVMAKGEETRTNLEIEGGYLLYHLSESIRELAAVGVDPIEYQVTFTGERFLLVINLEKAGRFFLLVSGAKGSYDLFRIRCERAAQAVSRVLRGRNWLRGM